MQFLLGMAVMSAVFICSYAAYKYGQASVRPRQAKTNPEERKRMERIREGFNNMMSYDVTTALKGKKVD